MVVVLRFSILLVGPRGLGCCVGEFAPGCRQGLQLAFYPKWNSVTSCHAKRRTCAGNLLRSVVFVLCMLLWLCVVLWLWLWSEVKRMYCDYE